MSQDLSKRLQGALLRIRGDHPFFGTLALFADLRMTDQIPTAATDGKTIWFNPQFIDKLEMPALCGLVAHELLHAALRHGCRRRERDALMWNIAADVVVNGMIRADTGYGLPEGGVEMPKLAHLSVEEIYEQLATGRHRQTPADTGCPSSRCWIWERNYRVTAQVRAARGSWMNTASRNSSGCGTQPCTRPMR